MGFLNIGSLHDHLNGDIGVQGHEGLRLNRHQPETGGPERGGDRKFRSVMRG